MIPWYLKRLKRMYLMFTVDVFVGGFPRLKHGDLTICLHFFLWCKNHKIHPTSNMTSSEPRPPKTSMNNSSRTSQWRHVLVDWHEQETGATLTVAGRPHTRSPAAGPECEWCHHFRGHVSLEFFLSRPKRVLNIFVFGVPYLGHYNIGHPK